MTSQQTFTDPGAGTWLKDRLSARRRTHVVRPASTRRIEPPRVSQSWSRLSAAFLIAWMVLSGNPPVLHAQTTDQIRTANQQISQLIDMGEYAQALGFAEKVLLLAEQAFGKDNSETLKSVGNLADVYKKLGRAAEAEAPQAHTDDK